MQHALTALVSFWLGLGLAGVSLALYVPGRQNVTVRCPYLPCPDISPLCPETVILNHNLTYYGQACSGCPTCVEVCPDLACEPLPLDCPSEQPGNVSYIGNLACTTCPTCVYPCDMACGNRTCPTPLIPVRGRLDMNADPPCSKCTSCFPSNRPCDLRVCPPLPTTCPYPIEKPECACEYCPPVPDHCDVPQDCVETATCVMIIPTTTTQSLGYDGEPCPDCPICLHRCNDAPCPDIVTGLATGACTNVRPARTRRTGPGAHDLCLGCPYCGDGSEQGLLENVPGGQDFTQEFTQDFTQLDHGR